MRDSRGDSMRICSNCNNQVEDDNIMQCPYCGGYLAGAEAGSTDYSPYSQGAEQTNYSQQQADGTPYQPYAHGTAQPDYSQPQPDGTSYPSYTHGTAPPDYSQQQPAGYPGYSDQQSYVAAPPAAYPSSAPAHGFRGPDAGAYKTAMALTIAGMVLLLITSFLPWYYMEEEYKYSYYESERILREKQWEIEVEASYQESYDSYDGDSTTESIDWSDVKDENEDFESMANMYLTIAILSIVGVIIGIIAVIMIAGCGLTSSYNPNIKKAAFGLSVGTAVLAIISIFILLALSPSAHDEAFIGDSDGYDYGYEDERSEEDGPWSSFWGSSSGKDDDGDEHSRSWGPHAGWYLALVGGILYLGGGVVINKVGKS